MFKNISLISLLLYGVFVFVDSKLIHAEENLINNDKLVFSASNAMASKIIIEESLNSFRKIIEAASAEKPIIIKDYKHSDWEMLNIGIPNHILTIEGTIRRQNYIIAKLKYELATEKRKSSSSNDDIISRLKEEYQKRKHEYSAYLKSIKFVD